MSDALCRLKANIQHQYLPDLFEVIKEYDFDIDRHMKTIHKKDDHLRTADKEIAALRAANARLQAWHDAVMGQESTVSQYYDAIGRRHFTRLGETFEQIGYQCQPLIIRPQPLAKE